MLSCKAPVRRFKKLDPPSVGPAFSTHGFLFADSEKQGPCQTNLTLVSKLQYNANQDLKQRQSRAVDRGNSGTHAKLAVVGEPSKPICKIGRGPVFKTRSKWDINHENVGCNDTVGPSVLFSDAREVMSRRRHRRRMIRGWFCPRLRPRVQNTLDNGDASLLMTYPKDGCVRIPTLRAPLQKVAIAPIRTS